MDSQNKLRRGTDVELHQLYPLAQTWLDSIDGPDGNFFQISLIRFSSFRVGTYHLLLFLSRIFVPTSYLPSYSAKYTILCVPRCALRSYIDYQVAP